MLLQRSPGFENTLGRASAGVCALNCQRPDYAREVFNPLHLPRGCWRLMYSHSASLLFPAHALLHYQFHPRPPIRTGSSSSDGRGIKPKHRILRWLGDAGGDSAGKAQLLVLKGRTSARGTSAGGAQDVVRCGVLDALAWSVEELSGEHKAHALETLLEIVDASRFRG